MDHTFTTATQDDDHSFYDELSRQIFLLTDEDDDGIQIQLKKNGGRRFNQRSAGGGGGWSVTPGNCFFSWSEGGEAEVPGWMERLWAANSGGTGVFIPRAGGVVHRSRKRHNKPRKSNERDRKHKDLESS